MSMFMSMLYKQTEKALMALTFAMVVAACGEKDVYQGTDNSGNGTETPVVKVANTFDFATTQKVNLTVDYSAFKTYGPVFFGVYAQNPIVQPENSPEEMLDEAVAPLFEDYTDANGKFKATIELPAYAKHLYVVTGNFFVGLTAVEALVQNGTATAVAEKRTVAATRGVTRAQGPGESTDDISRFPWLSYIVDSNGKSTGELINKEWKNWLGTWNSASGYPDYMLDKSTASAGLVFTDAEMEGLYATVGTAFTSSKIMNDEYVSAPDLLLEKASEVTFTLLGGSTCWNSTLGYYYYFDNEKPATPQDMNVIMLFPNTQDGQWAKGNQVGNDYGGNIGVHRGDVVQLKYYPNIANNDRSGETTIFPQGIRIGFVLKTQSWAMQGGNEYGIPKWNERNKKYNVWATSTDGLSVCRPIGNQGAYTNPEGKSRAAKFGYKSATGDVYTIISFEDAMNDQDFDDLIFALKPLNVFAPLPEIENRKSTSCGVYAFEDLWPSKGDYDLNDAIIDFKHMKEFNTSSRVIKESFLLTTYQNYVELSSGLALTLNTKVTPSTIVMKKQAPGATVAETVTFTKDGDVYYLTSDIKGELGTTYILELTYSNGLNSTDQLASIQPFIYRSESDGKTWEVHVPFEAPTAKMNISYFGKDDDCSDVSKNLYYVREGNYPFAFFLNGANISVFQNTILKRENESRKISDLFPGFLEWSTSKGATNADWYIQ